MSTVKEAAREMIDALPDNCTWEEFEYRVQLLRAIRQGLRDKEAGRVFTPEEVEQRLPWLASPGQKTP